MIAPLSDAAPVAITGQVAEVFGNQFIVQDEGGRTLVDAGPRGEHGRAVTKGETVTVQGRVDDGCLHANVLTRADGSSEAFGPPPPRHHEHGPGERPGPRADRGFERGPDCEAPPPAP